MTPAIPRACVRRSFLRSAAGAGAWLGLGFGAWPASGATAVTSTTAGALTYRFFDGAGGCFEIDLEADTVTRRTPHGGAAWTIGGAGSGAGQFDQPIAVASDPATGVYVLDSGNSRVQVFAHDGTHLRDIGEFGEGPGQLRHPDGNIAVRAGRVLVPDRMNGRLRVFELNGRFAGDLGAAGDLRPREPQHVVYDAGGRLHVADPGRDEIAVFGTDDRRAGSYAGARRDGEPLGFVVSMLADPRGGTVVAESSTGWISVFDARGARSARFRIALDGGVLATPLQLTRSPTGEYLALCVPDVGA